MMKKYLVLILIYGLFSVQSAYGGFLGLDLDNLLCVFGCAGDIKNNQIAIPSPAEVNGMGKEFIKGIRSELDDMNFGDYGQELATGVQTVFNDTMQQLFKQRINPMIEDVNKLIELRANEINNMAEERLKQLDDLIAKNLQEMDRIILNTLSQFEKLANQLVADVKEEWITYGFDRLDQSLNRTDRMLKERLDQIKNQMAYLDTLLTKNIELTDETIQQGFDRLDRSIEKTKTDLVESTDETIQQGFDRLDGSIEKTRTDLVEPSLKNLFDGLQQTIHQAQTQIIDQGLDKTSDISTQLIKDINQTIDHIKLNILTEAAQQGQAFLTAVQQQIISDAEQKASGLLTQLQQDIILETGRQIETLRAAFREDIDHYFDRTEYLINLVNCHVDGTLEKIRLDISQLSNSFSQQVRGWLPWSTKQKRSIAIQLCYNQLGLTEEPKHFEYATIYEIHKCHLLNQIAPTTPITRIKAIYLDLQSYAARMRCLQRGASDSANRHYTWDWIEFGHRYQDWASKDQQ